MQSSAFSHRVLALLMLTVIVLTLFPVTAFAQEDGLQIRLRRNWGYGGFGEIQGLFTVSASGPDNLAIVTFYLDGEVMAEVDQAPFSYQFTTDDYPLGEHTFSATGTTSTGDTLNSNEITTTFVEASEGWSSVSKILIPTFSIIVVALLISFIVTFYTGKKRLNPPAGTARQYGYSGGAICPKCDRPTPLHWFGLNLGTRKYDRCENCLKWSSMKALNTSQLRQAEADELLRLQADENALLAGSLSEDQKLKKDLDESRFQDL